MVLDDIKKGHIKVGKGHKMISYPKQLLRDLQDRGQITGELEVEDISELANDRDQWKKIIKSLPGAKFK